MSYAEGVRYCWARHPSGRTCGKHRGHDGGHVVLILVGREPSGRAIVRAEEWA